MKAAIEVPAAPKKPKVKRVRITLSLSPHFVRMLSANVELGKLRDRDQLDPAQLLALVVCSEARGNHLENTHALTPIEWRDDIEPVGELRVVELEE